MKTYTIAVDATFTFDVKAESEQQARELGRKALQARDPVDDYGGFYGSFHAPWVAPARAVDGFPSLEVTDVWGEDE